MSEPAAVKQILVIRSATRILNATLEALKKEFPESRICLLSPQVASTSEEPHPLVDEVITFNVKGRMTLCALGMKYFRQLRRKKFDIAVSLYNIEHGMGYSNIDLIAWAIKPKAIRGYNSRLTFQNIDGCALLSKIVSEKSTILISAANALATILLFSAITLGLIIEWGIRKIYPAPDKKHAL